jgi:hypothetical protein
MMELLIVILAISAVSLAFNAGYIVHELGLFPHTKDRSSPADRKFWFASRYNANVKATHNFQIVTPLSNIARRHAHAAVYSVEDPYKALTAAISRYEHNPSRSHYDDLIHLSNYICNHVRCDEKVNELISRIHRLIHERPVREA